MSDPYFPSLKDIMTAEHTPVSYTHLTLPTTLGV